MRVAPRHLRQAGRQAALRGTGRGTILAADSAQTCHSSRGLSPATPRQTLMTYLVTIISLTPDTRLTEKREAFSMTLMVCVICVDTLSRMRWSRPAGDSRLDDDVVACDGWLDDAIAAVGTLQPRGRRGRGCLGALPSIGLPTGRAPRGTNTRECRATCRTPTSSSTRLARDGWPAARKRARTPRVPQGGREARAPQRRRYTAY